MKKYLFLLSLLAPFFLMAQKKDSFNTVVKGHFKNPPSSSKCFFGSQQITAKKLIQCL
jgi:hypothetical protein